MAQTTVLWTDALRAHEPEEKQNQRDIRGLRKVMRQIPGRKKNPPNILNNRTNSYAWMEARRALWGIICSPDDPFPSLQQHQDAGVKGAVCAGLMLSLVSGHLLAESYEISVDGFAAGGTRSAALG